MGIRKEILAAIREGDVRGPRDTLARIEQLVTEKRVMVKRLIVTETECHSHGFTPSEAVATLLLAAVSIKLSDQDGCETCPDKEAYKNGK